MQDELGSILSNPHENILLDDQFGTMATTRGPAKGLIILLHGWDMGQNFDPGIMFRPFCDMVRQHFAPQGYIVLSPAYNTHESWYFAAKHIYQFLLQGQFPLNNVHLFGYSMGGLVSRQLVVEGLHPRSLVTFCTPNMGTAHWVSSNPLTLVNNGAMSMATWSEHLKNLNNHPRDLEFRKMYHMIGLSYYADNEMKQRHDNDSIVEVTSAIMWNANQKPGHPIHWSSHKVWGWGKGVGDPHGTAQCFPEIQPAYNLFCDLVHKAG